MASSCTNRETKYGSTCLRDQNSGVESADRQTDRKHTDRQKILKNEGPKIMSYDIFYFKNVIIGGPMNEESYQNSK